MIQRFVVSRDDALYEAWPDVALAGTGRLVCVFSECTHHGDRSYTRIMLCHSDDRGRSWSPKRALSEPLRRDPRRGKSDPYWNCARINALPDGRLVAIADRIAGSHEGDDRGGKQSNWFWFSADEGETWDGPHATPVHGIVPDKPLVLRRGAHAGRWILAAHTVLPSDEPRAWTERLWYSNDDGRTWRGPITVVASRELRLCEGSILELPDASLVCFLRENSFEGLDCYKAISTDGGLTWSEPIRFPLPGCHRPVAGLLRSGRVVITYRFLQGGKGWLGWWMQNTLAALTDVESCLARDRAGARCRIMPLDYDRSPESDCGYTGWVQFPDTGELYVVNYLLDDAPKAQIRGYSLYEDDFTVLKPRAG